MHTYVSTCPTVHTHIPHELGVERIKLCGGLNRVLVDIGHMLGEAQVILRVTFVPDEPEQVKPGQQSRRQLDISLG
jgi:hypothetical protein